MNDPRYLQDGFQKQLAHAIEECGEFLAAAGKTQRWGAWSFNPLIPPHERESNFLWVRRELKDVQEAMARLDATMDRIADGETEA